MMTKLIPILLAILLSFSVQAYGVEDPVLKILANQKKEPTIYNSEYKIAMQDLIIKIAKYAKSFKGDFNIIIRNSPDIFFNGGDGVGGEAINRAITNYTDGLIIDGLHFGKNEYGVVTPQTALSDTEYQNKLDIIKKLKSEGISIGAIDYYTDDQNDLNEKKYNDNIKKLKYNPIMSEKEIGHPFNYDSSSEEENKALEFNRRLNDMDEIPEGISYLSLPKSDKLISKLVKRVSSPPYKNNSENIGSFSKAKNFLFLSNLRFNGTEKELVDLLKKTNYDVIVMDNFINDHTIITAKSIDSLKRKRSGSRRLILANINIGMASKSKYYWQSEWDANPPSWIEVPSKKDKSLMVTKYWDPAWQYIITNHDMSYMYGIMQQHFDGVVLNGVTSYKLFPFYEF